MANTIKDNIKLTNVGSLKYYLEKYPDETPLSIFALYLPTVNPSTGIIQKQLMNMEIDSESKDEFIIYGDISNPNTEDDR